MKIRIILTFLFLLNLLHVFGQKLSKDEFIQDLDYTYQLLKQSTSYKTQKHNHQFVELKYIEIKNELTDSLYIIDAFDKLYSLVAEINDLHNSLFTTNAYHSLKNLEDQSTVDSILSDTKGFYPYSNRALDSLLDKIENNQTDSIEGIYYVDNLIKIGVIKEKSNYVGIVLESPIPIWRKGEVMAYITPKSNNKFTIIAGLATSKQLIPSVDYFEDGVFYGRQWTQHQNQDKFYFPNQNQPIYFHEKINSQTDFLRIGSFQLNQLDHAIKFYEQIKAEILPENLIIDLRHNFGGNDKNSNLLLNILKKYKGNVYILINYSTVSNAEQFTLRAKKLPNVTILGKDTRGMLTYGINYSPKLTSPSGRFKYSFTDLKDEWKKFIKYEGIGISPDKYLSNDRNWLDQVLEIIN